MAEEEENILPENEGTGEAEESSEQSTDHADESIVKISGMYEEWFLDYASYVILERAVPHLHDGLKPVQRRILHSLWELDDGRFHKVANAIGNTMKYHPHGDASIGDAMVQIGQKELMFDCQGNWGNTLTGDRAAAPRYIEVRLSKFAKKVAFNPKTTHWLLSYDGRNKEPETLPMKFPLLLAQGVEGIAVGLACKLLPHNFNEIIDASIAYLRGKGKSIYPDFLNGGMADFSNYNDGKRGGKIRVRARIRKEDAKTLIIHEIPFGTTTSSLIDSILKANDKGKIKVKKIEDNTAEHAEIVVHLPSGTSPDKMIDALYAFTDCEVSISPNACVILDDKPHFLGVSEILKYSVDHTKDLLELELKIKQRELQEQWHFASLEKIFIEKRIYRDIEEEETWEGVMSAIDKGIHKYVSTPGRKSRAKGVIKLDRDVTDEDIVRLTEIKIKRISKFDSNKAEENLKKLEEQLKAVQHDLDHLVDFAIAYYKDLKKEFGKGRERKTEIRTFDNIVATKVVVANKKLYVNRKEGFIGYGLKKDEFVSECSDIDDIIVFRRDGVMTVTKVDTKKFVGKDILHVAVWKKGDARTVYHMVYQDGSAGPSLVKRFNVTGVTRDKEYDLTKGKKGSRVLYFSANPNGESEVINIRLRPRPKLKNLRFDFDFSELAIKSRGVKGNILTKHLVSKVELKEKGESTLAARKIWMDEVTRRLNVDGRGKFLGRFGGDDRLLLISDKGYYRLVSADLSLRFDDDLFIIEKWRPERPISVIYYDGTKERYMVKRFLAEPSSKNISFITDHPDSELFIASTYENPEVVVEYDKRSSKKEEETFFLKELISVKGITAAGNRLTADKPKSFALIEQEDEQEEPVPASAPVSAKKETVSKSTPKSSEPKKSDTSKKSGLKVDQLTEKAVTVEFDVESETSSRKKPNEKKGEGQITLF
ncbi:MAG: DNA gyrase/topoisomerase IV subunit A [Flavobacteriales bacterium]|nr:DNA gyrase/topoisomerase IV subunit A [Flavobacteriales bacterium]